MSDAYLQFLREKMCLARFSGFDVPLEEINPALKPHTRDIARWIIKGGNRACFASFGLHKTATHLEVQRQIGLRHPDAYRLAVVPLGVRHEFFREVRERFTGDCAMDLRFIRRDSEIDDPSTLYLTNYEAVREGNVTPSRFRAAGLDEASILRSYGSKTYQEFLPAFEPVEFKSVYTATPDPNRFKELIHYAGFLGVMDTGQALTRFFQRDSEKAGNLTLYPHKVQEFWMWVASWAVIIRKPSDLGYSDEGYDLPELDVRWHELPSDYAAAGTDKQGQGLLIQDTAKSLSAAAREKRDSMAARVERVRDLVSADPADHFVVWHHLDAERDALAKALPDAVTVTGGGNAAALEQREQTIIEFSDGQHRILSTKPVIAGSGCNFQRHCHREIFAGADFKFNDFIQAVHRVHRFGQSKPVRIDIIHTEAEREIVAELQAKWRRHDEQQERVAALVRQHGLDHLSMQDALARTIGVERKVVTGECFEVAHNDAVLEAMEQPENSVGLIVTSIPFANHYEYTPSYNDFGHTENNDHFWRQMDFLTPQLFRILKPGRLACVHVKDRVLFQSVTGLGAPTMDYFHEEASLHLRKHGFVKMAIVTITTDVVRENNSTYRLGYTEMLKDATKMGRGCNEYLLLFRKPQTDLTRGYADEPVTKDPFDYSLARWQVDAHGYYRSSGNRLMSAEEMARLGPAKLAKFFTEESLRHVYDYQRHVAIGEELAQRDALPKTFACLEAGSPDPLVWTDVNRMLTLNNEQSSRAVEKHVCLARDSRVLTKERGYVAIQDVQVGENVLTHKGRWRKVQVARCTGARPCITLTAQGVPGLTLTPDHKLWARKSDWVRSRDGAERVEPAWVEAQSTLGGYVNLQLPEEESGPKDDLWHWWTIGRWLADGHWDARGAAIISCGDHELEGLRWKLGDRAGACLWTGTAHQVRILDPTGELKEVLHRCGHGASGKHVPSEAFTMPKRLAEALLLGYLSGDGHFREDRQRWMVTSVGRDLLLGMAVLAQRVFNTVASVYAGRPPRSTEIQGRKVECLQEWVLCFDLPADRRKQQFILEDGAWKKVRALEDAGERETWCLRIEEDESFTAEGCIVKNCPLQLDIVDRAIEFYSNKGDVVYDPFHGLGTVGVRALKLGRRARGSELSGTYFADQVHYLRAAERAAAMPTLFDLLEAEPEPEEA